MIRSALKRAVRSAGYEISRLQPKGISGRQYSDVPEDVKSIVRRCLPFTVTSCERLIAMCQAADYVARHGIPGAFVECGLFKGGSTMAAALRFLHAGRSDIDFYLYDTYEGLSEPGEQDVAVDGTRALDLYRTGSVGKEGMYASPLDEVRANLRSTGYPDSRLHYVKGMVEDTIPQHAPERIAFLRLDTDWYRSTKHELVHLFPRLSPGGVPIIDDYGHWAGARQATDEYFAEAGVRMLLNRIDYTGRIGVKLG